MNTTGFTEILKLIYEDNFEKTKKLCDLLGHRLGECDCMRNLHSLYKEVGKHLRDKKESLDESLAAIDS